MTEAVAGSVVRVLEQRGSAITAEGRKRDRDRDNEVVEKSPRSSGVLVSKQRLTLRLTRQFGLLAAVAGARPLAGSFPCKVRGRGSITRQKDAPKDALLPFRKDRNRWMRYGAAETT
jgi:hypothetical protein